MGTCKRMNDHEWDTKEDLWSNWRMDWCGHEHTLVGFYHFFFFAVKNHQILSKTSRPKLSSENT
jgi:hypothetical protein